MSHSVRFEDVDDCRIKIRPGRTGRLGSSVWSYTFHEYIYGRHFTLVSDHKPLLSLFNERNGVSEMASARIQRWALKLSGYHYTFRHKPGIMNGNADGLSRLPLRGQPDVLEESPPPEVVSLLHRLEALKIPVSADEIKRWTREDPVLARVLKYVLQGWPATLLGDFADAMKPYKSRANELLAQDDCVLWGARVLVPEKRRQAVLAQLHDGHPGCSRMKGIARTIVWWPGIDSEIEGTVRKCLTWQQQARAPPLAPLCAWEWPEKPWSRLHVDYAGSFMGAYFLSLRMLAPNGWIFTTRAILVHQPSQ